VVDKADLLPFDLNITRESMLAAATI
jgi:hypothetical protein